MYDAGTRGQPHSTVSGLGTKLWVGAGKFGLGTNWMGTFQELGQRFPARPGRERPGQPARNRARPGHKSEHPEPSPGRRPAQRTARIKPPGESRLRLARRRPAVFAGESAAPLLAGAVVTRTPPSDQLRCHRARSKPSERMQDDLPVQKANQAVAARGHGRVFGIGVEGIEEIGLGIRNSQAQGGRRRRCSRRCCPECRRQSLSEACRRIQLRGVVPGGRRGIANQVAALRSPTWSAGASVQMATLLLGRRRPFPTG